jgi:Spy/CpxP family protein refolding chaperone
MHTLTAMLFTSGLLLVASFAAAQPPAGGRDGAAKSADADAFVARLMAFDKNKDGKLTKDEITDERLHRLFDRADTNKDGVVTREELLALFAREAPAAGGPAGGPPGGFGPPGPGGPGGRGPGGFGGPPQPGQILPGFLQERLSLTEEQKKQVSDIQKDVDARLEKILTAEQRKQLQELQERGPGGPGRGPGGEGPDRPGERPRR